MSAYTTRTSEFAEDRADVLAVYRAAGVAAASARCGAIADARGLADHERLTLADACRRAIVLGLAS